MFQNTTKVVVKTADTIVGLLDIISINTESIKTLSEAGNAKADFILKSALHDVAAQDIELEAKIAALTASAKAAEASSTKQTKA